MTGILDEWPSPADFSGDRTRLTGHLTKFSYTLNESDVSPCEFSTQHIGKHCNVHRELDQEFEHEYFRLTGPKSFDRPVPEGQRVASSAGIPPPSRTGNGQNPVKEHIENKLSPYFGAKPRRSRFGRPFSSYLPDTYGHQEKGWSNLWFCFEIT